MEIISDIDRINIYELENFVSKHPYANFFQSTNALRFFQSLKNYDPLLVVAYKENKIIGSLLGVVISEGKGLKGHFSRRCIVWGGPIVEMGHPEIWMALINEMKKVVCQKAIYIEIRNLKAQNDKIEIVSKLGFQFDEHLNYIVSIHSLDDARAGLSKSKKRQINKSLRNGARIVHAQTIEQVSCFYRILHGLYQEKVKKPLPAFDFFSRFFCDKSLGVFFLVEFEERIVGGIMCPVYKDTIYEWFVCGLDGEIKGIYPSVLATWAPIEYAANNGFKYFDFMGAGKPDQDYGVREFKSKFGGELVDFGRFVRINKKLQYHVGKVGLEIIKKFN
ncbi:MAG: lipid II:glycine glycyltransferase FemX [bacterium]